MVRQPPQIVSISGQHIESIQLDLFVALPRVQGVKIRDAVDRFFSTDSMIQGIASTSHARFW
jgi:hypothetical protein